MFVDRFSSLDELKGRDRADQFKILAVLAKVGRFSAFEVDDRMARPITALLASDWVITKHEETVRDEDGCGTHVRSLYPWTYVTLTEAGKTALKTASGTSND